MIKIQGSRSFFLYGYFCFFLEEINRKIMAIKSQEIIKKISGGFEGLLCLRKYYMESGQDGRVERP